MLKTVVSHKTEKGVFAISIRKDIDTKKFTFAKPYDLKLRLKDMLEDNVDEKYYLSENIQNRLKVTDSTFTKNIIGTTKPECRKIGQRDLVYQKDSIMGTLVATDYKQPKQIIETKNECKQALTLSGGKWDNIYESARRVYSDDGISPTIHTCGGGNTETKIVCEQRTDEGLRFFKDDCVGTSRTIDSCGDKRVIEGSHQNWKQDMYEKFIEDSYGEASGVYTNQSETFGYRPPIKNLSKTIKGESHDAGVVLDYRVRKLTPKECWRLMGFKDEDFEKVSKLGISDSAGYKQAGNSIVTNCISQIMEHIYKAQYDDAYICFDENFTKPQEI